MATAPKTSVTKLVLWQTVALLVLIALFSIQGSVALLSVFLGSLLAAIPVLLFTRQAFRFAGARQAREVLRSFYWGETLKLASCAVGFALVFKFAASLDLLALWLSFVVQLFLPILLAATGQLKPSLKNTTAKF